MKYKRLTIGFIILALLLVIIISLFSVFNVKSVDVVFEIGDYGKTYSRDVQKKLDKYVNKSIITVKNKDIENTLKSYPYLEITGINKSMPNRIEVSLKERQEIYLIKQGEDEFILDETGFILAKNSRFGDKFIEITGVNLVSPEVGNYALCDGEKTHLLFKEACNISSIASYTDNLGKIEIDYATAREDVVFYMRTGLKITVTNALDSGEEKMVKAFELFDKELTDYQKSHNNFYVYKTDGGEIKAVFTEYGG